MKVTKQDEGYFVEGMPNIEHIMKLDDQKFGDFVAGALGQFEMSQGRYAFNNAASREVTRGDVPNYILTPLKDKNLVLLYLPEVEPYIGAALYAQSKFEKTGKIDTLSRERFLTEFMRDELRSMTGIDDKEERALFTDSVMAETKKKLDALNPKQQAQNGFSVTYTFKPGFPAP